VHVHVRARPSTAATATPYHQRQRGAPPRAGAPPHRHHDNATTVAPSQCTFPCARPATQSPQRHLDSASTVHVHVRAPPRNTITTYAQRHHRTARTVHVELAVYARLGWPVLDYFYCRTLVFGRNYEYCELVLCFYCNFP